LADVFDGSINVGDNPNRQDQVQVFGLPVVLGCFCHDRHELAGERVASQFDIFRFERNSHHRKKLRRDRLVNEQRFHCVTHTWSVHLGIDH
jgi:hypothetical protein